MPDPISRDGVIRAAKQAGNAAKIQIQNEAAKGLNAAVNFIFQQAINALPPPLNFGANVATKGLYVALKATGKVIPVKNPSEDQDSIKTIALAIAFAIIQAIWCFIKSLLHPLPIIGSFFPLCSDDIPDAPADAAQDSENIAAANAKNIQNNVNQDAVLLYQNELNRADQVAQGKIQEAGTLPEPVLGPQGMTFDEYVASIPTPQSNPPITSLINATPPANSTSNIEQNAEWEGTNRDPNELRRLFGL